MAGFIAANPGLSSRFAPGAFRRLTADELVTNFTQHADVSGNECTGPLVATLRAYFAAVERGNSFGNGRYARQVLDMAIARHARRTRAAWRSPPWTIYACCTRRTPGTAPAEAGRTKAGGERNETRNVPHRGSQSMRAVASTSTSTSGSNR